MSDFVWTGRDDREDGPAARRVYHAMSPSGRRALIGFASDEGVRRNQGRPGARHAPDVIRTALANLPIARDFPEFTDRGNIVVADNDLETAQVRLGEAVAQALSDHDRVLVLGGGHETAYGSYLGLRAHANAHAAGARIGILNFDAHLDIRNIGPAGPSSGTPFNQMRASDPDGFDYLCIGVNAHSNTQALFDRAAEWGVGVVTDRALENGLGEARAQIDALVQRIDHLYLTIDLDVLPYYQAPGVSCPAVRGVDFSTVHSLVEHALKSIEAAPATLPVCDVVELCPDHDGQSITARTAATLAHLLLSA